MTGRPPVKRPAPAPKRRGNSVQTGINMLGQFLVFLACGAAPAGDLVQLGLGQVYSTVGHIAFTQIFASQHEIRIDFEGLVVVAKSLLETAGFAVAVANVVQDPRIVLVGNRLENLNSPFIFAGKRQSTSLLIERLIRQDS